MSGCETVFPAPGPNPVMLPELAVALQVKVAPVTCELREMLVLPPEQKV